MIFDINTLLQLDMMLCILYSSYFMFFFFRSISFCFSEACSMHFGKSKKNLCAQRGSKSESENWHVGNIGQTDSHWPSKSANWSFLPHDPQRRPWLPVSYSNLTDNLDQTKFYVTSQTPPAIYWVAGSPSPTRFFRRKKNCSR